MRRVFETTDVGAGEASRPDHPARTLRYSAGAARKHPRAGGRRTLLAPVGALAIWAQGHGRLIRRGALGSRGMARYPARSAYAPIASPADAIFSRVVSAPIANLWII